MSVIPPRQRPLQQFFRSGPMPCPYLPGRVERKLFTRISGIAAPEVNSILSQAGFRRSHDIVYRPICPACNACVPVRVPVAIFQPNRSFRRVLRANRDLTMTEVATEATGEQFRLFSAYQRSRHEESDMASMSMSEFIAMIEEGAYDSAIFEARDPEGRLVAAILTDRLADGTSAVYSFFDTAQTDRSLGTYVILKLIEHCQVHALPYLYLGYWISGCRKMSYKGRFRPLETLGPEGWTRLVVDEAPDQ